MNKHTPIHTRKQKHINYDNHTYLQRLQLSKNPLISTFSEFSIVSGGKNSVISNLLSIIWGICNGCQ